MKIIIYSIAAISASILLSSCSSAEKKAVGHAEEICECLQDAGLNKSIDYVRLSDRSFQRNLTEKMEKTVPRCMLSILKEMDEEIAELSKKEKKEYTKAFLKGCIDTECSDIALDLIPYDLLGIGLLGLERQLDRQEEYKRERDWDYEEEYDDYDDYYEELEELEDLF